MEQNKRSNEKAMVEAVLKELASGGKEEILAAGEHLVKKVKISQDYRRLFVETGEFFVNYGEKTERLFADMELVLSEQNMLKLAKELETDSGYTLKSRLLNELISLMDRYEIPREYENYYATCVLNAILNQLPEVAPEKYDRYFQSSWREEQNTALSEIKQKIENIETNITKYERESISIETADQLDLNIRRQTVNPRIGIEFFNIDDDSFKDEFENQKENEIIKIRARCREEAVYCIVNELWKENEKRAIFIVRSLEDWEKLSLSAATGNIYIPWFWAEEISAIEKNTNIFIYTDEIPSFSRKEIILRPRTFNTICNALVKAGMDINEASRLVSETHGLYIPMKNKIFNGQCLKLPEWIKSLPENIKKTALLLGKWTDLEGDQSIVSLLSGMKYEDFITNIMPFTKGEDPFIYVVREHGQNSYYLASVENSWEYMDVEFNDDIWKIFRQLFMEVINKVEKQFVATSQERIIAQMNGEHLNWSGTLRSGMIRSLIMKAYYKRDNDFQNSLDELANSILDRVQTDEQWKFISCYFTDLCEIAPKAMLKRLNSEFDEPTGLWKLFDSQVPDSIFDKKFYIDILLGVDELLVQNEYVTSSFMWLLRLDDKSYEYTSNAPRNTIEKVLCTWCNFSAYKTVDEKEFAAQKALELDRNAWDYIYDALPANSRSILGEIHKPKYRAHVETTTVTIKEMNQIVERYVLLLMKKIDFIPERCGKLLEIADELPDQLFENIFSSVIYQSSQMNTREIIKLKKLIRKLIYKHRFFSSASWAMGEKKVRKYETLLEKITVAIPEYEYAYLFDSDKDIILLNPVPYEEKEYRKFNLKRVEELLRTKLNEFMQNKLDLSVLVEACSIDNNSNLGNYLARYGTENDFNQTVFETLYAGQSSGTMALDYCRGMVQKDKCVFEKVIKRKNELQFNDNFVAELYQIQAINTTSIPEIDTAENKIKELFWKNRRAAIGNNYEWALRECRKFGTISTYLELLYHANQVCQFNNETLYYYLVDVYKIRSDDVVGNVGYYLKELLKPVQEAFSTDLDKANKIANIEVNFFGILHWENMRCFQSKLKSAPDAYAEIASIIYKRDDENTGNKTKFTEKTLNAMFRLFGMAHFCPAEKNGIVNLQDLEEWVCEFKKLLLNNHQVSLFGLLLGRLWAYAPAGKDNYYPCEAVREVIEKYADESMITEYKVALFNQRGVYSPSAGREERAIADRYKNTADNFKCRYPKTAQVFYDMHKRYITEADEERTSAENGHF